MDSSIISKLLQWNWTSITYIVLLCILVLYVIYILLFYSFKTNISRQNEDTAKKLANDKISALLNGSGINNIPNLNIVSTNPIVSKANECGKGPVYVGTTTSDRECVQTCANSTASSINVSKNDTYIYNDTILTSGAYCIIGPRPLCNMNTSYAMMTINSVVCQSKFPEIVGGVYGSTMVACNNQTINDPQNYLWDYQSNKRFDPLTTQIQDANEILPDGTYRFRCHFNGVDVQQNKYIAHPFNRFQPIRNYCASATFAAHPNVKTVFDDDNSGSYTCDCGNYDETRLKNIHTGNPMTLCSAMSYEVKNDVRSRQLLTVPYRCFTLFSPISDIGRYPPCPNEQLTREGSQYGSVVIPFSYNTEVPIEHPAYKDFSSSDDVVISSRDIVVPIADLAN
ncbi:pif-2 [Esparto virus]|uniref:Pif-2 n=1 Tax=Esparto virus TaxID=2072209 RepID=A0A2I7G2X9_9VIRU|nr:pif-2 [Esparto virus]AUQ43976.1 pif-2 [Esparto virus]